MDGVIGQIAVGLGAFILFLGLHFIIWHFELANMRGVSLLTKLAFVSYVLVFGFTLVATDMLSNHVWVSVPLFSMLVMFYLHFYTGIDRSVSVRLLGEMVQAKNRQLPFDTIREIYPQEYMMKHRLELLEQKDWLQKKDGQYTCQPKGTWLAKLELFLIKLYGLKITG